MFRVQSTPKFQEPYQNNSPDSQASRISINNSCTTKDETFTIEKKRAFSQKKLTLTTSTTSFPIKKNLYSTESINKFVKPSIRPSLGFQLKKSNIEQNINKVSLKKFQNVETYNSTAISKNDLRIDDKGKIQNTIETIKASIEERIKESARMMKSLIEAQGKQIISLKEKIQFLHHEINQKDKFIRQVKMQKEKQRIQIVKLQNRIQSIVGISLQIQGKCQPFQAKQQKLNQKISRIDSYLQYLEKKNIYSVKKNISTYVKNHEEVLSQLNDKLSQSIDRMSRMNYIIQSIQNQMSELKEQIQIKNERANWNQFQDFENNQIEENLSSNDDFFFYPKSPNSLERSIKLRASNIRSSVIHSSKFKQLKQNIRMNYYLPLACKIDEKNRLVNINNNMYFKCKEGSQIILTKNDIEELMNQKYIKVL